MGEPSIVESILNGPVVLDADAGFQVLGAKLGPRPEGPSIAFEPPPASVLTKIAELGDRLPSEATGDELMMAERARMLASPPAENPGNKPMSNGRSTSTPSGWSRSK